MLSYQQLGNIITRSVRRLYTEMTVAPSFLKSFFRSNPYPTATVSVEIERLSETIAYDVERGDRGNRNMFSVWSEKEYLPPYFNEYFDIATLKSFDRLPAQNMAGSPGAMRSLIEDVQRKYGEQRKKIERAIELMAAQVFNTGSVTMINGDTVNYARRATSMVDVSATGGYWSDTAATVEAQLVASAQFIRQYGKNSSGEFNLVISGSAWQHLQKTDFFDKKANYQNVKLIDITMPQKQAFGPGYHGTIVAGSYKFHIWTYDEMYQAVSGSTKTWTRFWPEYKALVLPTAGYDFELAFGSVPMIIEYNGQETIGKMAGEWFTWYSVDKEKMAQNFHLASAPLPIPYSIDQIYTMQVLSTGGAG